MQVGFQPFWRAQYNLPFPEEMSKGRSPPGGGGGGIAGGEITRGGGGSRGASRSQSALHMHVLVCICSNVRQFHKIIGMIQM